MEDRSQQPEVHDVNDISDMQIQHKSRVVIVTHFHDGELEENGTITVKELDSSSFILLSAKPAQVDDLIKVLTHLLKERKTLYGNEDTGE